MSKLKNVLYACTAALAMSAVVFAVSCKKSSTPESTSTASDQAVAEKSYADAQTISEDAYTAGNGSSIYRTTGIQSTGCATVTSDTSGGNTVITINFGTTDCVCADGRKRRGEIIVTYPTGSWNTVGASRTITFSNYYQNDNQIQGTKTVTYEGLNTSNQPYFNVTINGSVTYSSTGKTVTVNWTRVRTWISGYTSGTPVWNINVVYSISGSGTMVNSAGQNVDINIPSTTPLIYAFSCEWIEAGTITYTLVSDGKTRSIDYGSNTAPYTCHDTAVVTLANGTQVTITLP